MEVNMKISILAVDDEGPILTLLARFLGKDPMLELETACCAYEAMSLCLQKSYDAIICDINLPDIDGPDLIRQMKGIRCCPEFVIFISGTVKSVPRDPVGNTVFIAKPFNPAQIIAALQPVKTSCLQRGAADDNRIV